MDDEQKELVRDLVKQNKALMAMVRSLQTASANSNVEIAEPQPRRSRTKPPPRRSPRNHSPAAAAAAPAASPRTPAGAALRKRLSYSSTGSSAKKMRGSSVKKKRTPATPQKAFVRKALGDAIKDNMDALLLDQHFRDSQRYFKLDEFEDRVNPIIDMVISDDEIDSSMLTRDELFRMAVDIAKKRERYVPRKSKLNLTKKRRLRMQKVKKRKQIREHAAAAAAAVPAADESSTASSDYDDATNAAESAHGAGTESEGGGSDGEELRALLELDDEAQNKRNDTKEKIVKKKAKKKAQQAAFDDYKKKMAAASVAKKTSVSKAVSAAKKTPASKTASAAKKTPASKAASVAKKTPASKKKQTVASQKPALRIGLKVQGWWPTDDGNSGAYYNGVVQAIDYESQTCHILYEDGDLDTEVPWTKTYILGGDQPRRE